MSRRSFAGGIVTFGWVAVLLVTADAVVAQSVSPTTRVAIVVGPSNHPPGTHEVAAGGRLMAYCLQHMNNLANVRAELFSGWPKEPAVLANVQSIVFIGDTFPPQRLPDTRSILGQLDVQMKRGCGIVCVHYATGLRDEDVARDGEHPLLHWMGGYFATRCSHHQSIAKIYPAAAIVPAAPGHPISRGWKPFTLHDEPYINNYFGPEGNKLAPNVTALATSQLPPESPRAEVVAWCVERPDSGRGFGIVMPHFYKSWSIEDLRRFILNGIVWSAKLEVPTGGVQTTLPDLLQFEPESVEPKPREEDLACLKSEPGNLAPSAVFYERLRQEAYAALDRRRDAYEQLKTADQIHDYQERLRGFFVKQLGRFPDRTPLNPQLVGTIEADGYRIEKVLFESQPNHHVTANLYLPLGPPPFPAVLVSSGHSRTAKTAEYNQRFGIMLARHGMAALCYDPIGQGERSQILTSTGKPQFSGTTQEHFLIGVGSILVGTNTARYRIWDAMRAIDYLASRPDIDGQRIGMTGCSGGGTLTSYVMALDDRVVCAAPACYLTTFRRLIETIGPQDAEQNLFGQVAFGLDHPDYVLLRAPRPTLISATTGDYFDQQGTWDTLRQAKRLYARLGFPERVDLVEAEGNHGVQPANLAAITQWLRRWLVGKDDGVSIAKMAYLPENELLCTEKGQVLRLPGEQSVFDLNAAREQQLAATRRDWWERKPREEALQAVRDTVGVRALRDIAAPKRDKAGRVDRGGYHIDKLVLRTDSGVPLPALTFHPKEPQDDAYLYLHEDGKLADGAAGGPIEKLVQDGFVVVAVDLRGQGETSSGAGKPDALLGDWKPFYLAYLLGKSYVGMHTEDALAAGHFVAYYQTEKPRKVHLVGVGQAAIPALHAAALEPGLFSTVTLRRAPRDWSSIVGQSVPAGQLTSTVHGALGVYDLPDLVRSLGPDKVRIEAGQ